MKYGVVDFAGCDLAIAELDNPTRRDLDDDDLNSEYDESVRCDLVAAAVGSPKFADLVDGKVEGSRPDNKIQSPRSPWSAPIDEG
jgi:hypothetical protein